MMDALVALTSAYKAEGKHIEFKSLRPASIKMLKKAEYWTKNVEYVHEPMAEHTEHAGCSSPDHSEYSKTAGVKRRITGLNAPSWADTPGPGVYESVAKEIHIDTGGALTAPSTPMVEVTQLANLPPHMRV